MPWWKKDDPNVPEALRNMSDQEILDAINKSKEVDSLKTQLTTTTTEFNSVKDRLAAIEANAPAPKREAPKGPTSFLEDENVAFNERLAPFAMTVLQGQARNAKFLAKQSLTGPKLAMWNKYESEIDEVMKTVDLTFQAQPETWLRALNSVIGNHVDDIAKAAADRSEFFSESATPGPNGNQPLVDPEKLGEDDQKIMARFGLTPEQYKASRKEMVVRSV